MGIASKCDFQRIHSNDLALSIKPFTMNTRTVARRDLDLAPILAAFAPFLVEESAIAERRREQVDALATDRERKRLDLCRIRRIGDPDLYLLAMEPILCSAPLGGKSQRAILSLSRSYAIGTGLVKPAGPGRTAVILRVHHHPQPYSQSRPASLRVLQEARAR